MKAILIPFRTLARKEIMRIMRIWSQTLIPPIVGITIYFIIFHQIFLHNTFHYASFNYLQFLTPGLIIMPVIGSAYNNTAGSFFSMKFMHAIEELVVASISIHSMIWGFLVGSILRGVATGLLVLIISCLFVSFSIMHGLLALLIMINTTIIFGLGGLINAIYAKKFDDIGIVPNFILTPLTYLGGVFFSVSSLSPMWHAIARCNPILYLVGSFRASILGVADVSIAPALGVSLLLSVVLYGYTYYLLKMGKNIRS